MFRAIQLILGVLGLLLAFGGDRLSMPLLVNGAIVCFGLFGMAVGWEGILTRHMVLGSRRRGTRQTYTGLSAVLQGVQFNLIGLFFIGASVLSYFNYERFGREIFLYFVRRPGLPLMGLGVLLFMQSLIMFSGYREINQGPGWMMTLSLIFSRMFPGVLLLVLGLGAAALGFLELTFPTLFDQWGGGFLETLYGVKP
jgi:hypothetical protein